jgi:signal transduction histidine kinase
LALLLRPEWLFLDSTYTFGIGLGLVLLLVEEHHRVERALIETDVRARQMAEDNAALVQEIHRRQQAEQELRRTSLQLMRAEEEERARIGREVHDGMGAQLMLLMMEIGQLKRQCAQIAPPLVPRVGKLETAVREIGDSTRFLSHYLYSPALELLGLTSALSDFCSEFGKQCGIQVQFLHAGVPKGLPRAVALCVFRIAQEALRNAKKHSGSREARVELRVVSGSIQLSVSDKGRGFNSDLAATASGRGLASMAERVRSLGGHFSVQSSPGQGTSVVASLPIGDYSEDALPKAS